MNYSSKDLGKPVAWIERGENPGSFSKNLISWIFAALNPGYELSPLFDRVKEKEEAVSWLEGKVC